MPETQRPITFLRYPPAWGMGTIPPEAGWHGDAPSRPLVALVFQVSSSGHCRCWGQVSGHGGGRIKKDERQVRPGKGSAEVSPGCPLTALPHLRLSSVAIANIQDWESYKARDLAPGTRHTTPCNNQPGPTAVRALNLWGHHQALLKVPRLSTRPGDQASTQTLWRTDHAQVTAALHPVPLLVGMRSIKMGDQGEVEG